MISTCIPHVIILKNILKNLICERNYSDKSKFEIVKWVGFYSQRANSGTKVFIHLEALFARLMLIIYTDKSESIILK